MPDRKRVLWLARSLPVPLNAGDRIYSARLAEALGHAGAEVHFVGLASPDAPELGADALDPIVKWEVIPGQPKSALSAVLSRRPLVGARFGTRRYARRVLELLTSNYDAIALDQYGLSWVLPHLNNIPCAKRPKIVHIAHDFETDVTLGIARGYRGNPLKRFALHLNANRTARAELELAAVSDVIVTLTPEDRRDFSRIGKSADVIVLPPGYDGPRRSERVIDRSIPRRVAIVGSYRWQAKQMNLNNFLAEADAIFASAGIELAIVGDAPSELQNQWTGKLSATKFLGYVDDVGIFLDTCRFGLVIDAIGGGFKLKVLDYVLTRTPVAALAPALGGQSPEVTKHFIISDNPAELAHAVASTIDNDAMLNEMQNGGYSAAEPLYSWRENGMKLLEAISADRRASSL